MTASKINSTVPANPETVQRLQKIDREILALLDERCKVLASAQRDASAPPGSIFSLSEHQQQALTAASVRPTDYMSIEAARRALAFVSGFTYQTSIETRRVAYLGPEHSYSYLAACKFFGSVEGLQAVNSIGAVFEEISRGQSTYGVVPIENSTDGRIVDTMNMFIRTPISICGEVVLPIHHNLLAKCGRDQIAEVVSKPQALSQCRSWLTEHLPNVKWTEVASTTAAAKIAAERPNVAAVASLEAALHHGLELIAPNIEDNPNNVTRFAIIGHEAPRPTGADKTSIMFQVPHQPGALADVMVLLRDNGLNLTWIESFPVPGVASEYYFFVELEGHIDQPSVASAMSRLKQTAIRFDFLGSYPKGVTSA